MKILFLSFAIFCSLMPVKGGAVQQPSTKVEKAQPPHKAEDAIRKSTEAEQSALRARALSIITQAAAEAKDLDDRKSAARILEAAAAALCEHDREQARGLFRAAFDEANAYYRDDTGSRRDQVTDDISITPPDIRSGIVRSASRCDSVFGEQLMEQYVEQKKREAEERRGGASGPVDAAFGKVDASSDDLLNITDSLLDTDRKAALALAQRAFTSGVPQSAGYFFTLLAARDRAAADQMYRMALESLLRDDAPMPGQLLLLSAYPFGEGQVWVGGGDGLNSYRMEVPTGFKVDETLARQFIDTAFAVLTRVAESDLSQFPDADARRGSAIFAARLLEPKVIRFRPALLAEWRGLSVKLSSAARRLPDFDHEFERIAEAKEADLTPEAEGRIEKLIEWAEKTTDPAQRDDLYRKAAFEADKLGDADRALSIADNIGDTDYRRGVRSALKFGAAMRALNAKHFDEARRLALEIDAADEQAYLFFEIARAALKEKDRGRAADLLAEAERRAEDAPDATTKLRILLGLTYLYASFDPPRAFEMAGMAIRASNKVPAYGPDQTRLMRVVKGRSGHGSSVAVDSVEEFDPGKVLAKLARVDFYQTLQLAQSLESKPLRLGTIIDLCAEVVRKNRVAVAQ